MEIKTKYSIGDCLFYVETCEQRVDIRKGIIQQINIGGKAFEKYLLGYNINRAENQLFTDFESAKKHAIQKQKSINDLLWANVNDLKDKVNWNIHL